MPALEKLIITPYTDEKFTRPARAVPMMIPINPDQYTRSLKIRYNDQKGAGSGGPSPPVGKIEKEKNTLVFYFDGTGVVPLAPGVVPAIKGIATQIEAFKAVTCAFDGRIHSPYFLKLMWGLLLFKCRLQSLTLNYRS